MLHMSTSQGERPSVDFVRQLLMSCGTSCTVQSMAPMVPNTFSAVAFTGITVCGVLLL